MSKKKTEVFRGLRGNVQLKDGGTAVIHRGEEMPSDAAAGEAKKFRELGLLGDPWAYEEPPDVTPEELLIADPSAEAPSTVEEVERLSGISATTPNEELDEFVANNNAKETVKAASDPETAQALLDAELSVRSEPRKSVVEGLVSKGARDPDATEPPAEPAEASSKAPPPEQVDPATDPTTPEGAKAASA